MLLSANNTTSPGRNYRHLKESRHCMTIMNLQFILLKSVVKCHSIQGRFQFQTIMIFMPPINQIGMVYPFTYRTLHNYDKKI